MRRVAWAFEERVVWVGADAARSAASGVAWPFEQIAWVLRRRLVWPLQDSFGSRGRPARTALMVVVLAAAALAGIAGARIGAPGDSGSPSSQPSVAASAAPARPVPVPVEPPPPAAPALKGVAPNFEPAGEDAADAATGSATAGTAAAAAPPPAPAPVQVNVATDELPAPALAVARRFAEAFVAYEVGDADVDVRLTFRETAAPALVKALAERPPRQPAGGDVPRAKVLNVVAGPRFGRTASVSVALLRLGDTSELRLQLERVQEDWRVSDVRG